MVIKSDGNGSFIITKTGMGMIIFLITIFTIIASIVTTAVTVQADVQYNMDGIHEMEDEVKLLSEHTNNHDVVLARIEERLIHIQNSLDKIENKLEEE